MACAWAVSEACAWAVSEACAWAVFAGAAFTVASSLAMAVSVGPGLNHWPRGDEPSVAGSSLAYSDWLAVISLSPMKAITASAVNRTRRLAEPLPWGSVFTSIIFRRIATRLSVLIAERVLMLSTMKTRGLIVPEST